MSTKRKVEIFSAGCSVCDTTVSLVKSVACPTCEVTVLDMKDELVANRAKTLGIQSVPAVIVDGKLAGCCNGRGVTEEALKASGIGSPKG